MGKKKAALATFRTAVYGLSLSLKVVPADFSSSLIVVNKRIHLRLRLSSP